MDSIYIFFEFFLASVAAWTFKEEINYSLLTNFGKRRAFTNEPSLKFWDQAFPTEFSFVSSYVIKTRITFFSIDPSVPDLVLRDSYLFSLDSGLKLPSPLGKHFRSVGLLGSLCGAGVHSRPCLGMHVGPCTGRHTRSWQHVLDGWRFLHVCPVCPWERLLVESLCCLTRAVGF